MNSNSFVLSGTVENAVDSEVVYLIYPIEKDRVWYERIDTAQIIGGKFRFEGRVAETTPAYLNFDNMDGEYLYLEPAKIKLRMDRKCPYAYTMSGLSVDRENAELQLALAESQQIRYESHRYLQNLNAQWEAADEKDKDSLWTLFYDAVQPCKIDIFREDSLRLHFALEHSDYAITPDLLYLSARRQVTDNKLLQQAYDRLPEASKHSIMGQLAGIQIGFHAQEWGARIGDNAFDFTRADASGKPIRLFDYKGGYVLLDFWASWCSPCIREVPKVKELYAQYSNKGLQIIGISCDEDRNKWLQAIEKNELTAYPQILAVESGDDTGKLLFEDQQNISDLYGIESIPQFVLLDKGGKILARWQHLGQEQFTYFNKILK